MIWNWLSLIKYLDNWFEIDGTPKSGYWASLADSFNALSYKQASVFRASWGYEFASVL